MKRRNSPALGIAVGVGAAADGPDCGVTADDGARDTHQHGAGEFLRFTAAFDGWVTCKSGGQEYVAASDRDFGLYIFRYTGS